MQILERHKSAARDNKAMKKFGIAMAIAVAAIFGIAIPLIFQVKLNFAVWIVSAAFVILAFVYPRILGYIYIPWMGLAEVLGYINSRIILFLVFCFVFVPTSLIMRLLKYDSLKKTLDKEVESYRIVRPIAPNPKQMERPF